eukprot:scaffold34603_cov212-Amphora_coffeaeformis.AAC.7
MLQSTRIAMKAGSFEKERTGYRFECLTLGHSLQLVRIPTGVSIPAISVGDKETTKGLGGKRRKLLIHYGQSGEKEATECYLMVRRMLLRYNRSILKGCPIF